MARPFNLVLLLLLVLLLESGKSRHEHEIVALCVPKGFVRLPASRDLHSQQQAIHGGMGMSTRCSLGAMNQDLGKLICQNDGRRDVRGPT